MATYLQHDLKYTEKSCIEYSLSLWGTAPIKVFIGLSTKPQHKDRYTFLDENKKDTIFGNACRFIYIDQAIEYILMDIKSYINKGKIPPILLIDGKIQLPFIKINDL